MNSSFVTCILLAIAFTSTLACEKPRRSNTGSGQTTGSKPAALLQPGKPFVAFSLPADNEETVSLGDFAGKVVLVNFWATWCAPCVAEMPALERLYQTYKAQGFAVVAISVDAKDSWPDVRAFAQRLGLSFPIAYDPDLTLPPKLGITGFPETFFIGPDGALLPFLDPDTKRSSVRIVSDRPWDSPVFVKAVGELLNKYRPNDTNAN